MDLKPRSISSTAIKIIAMLLVLLSSLVVMGVNRGVNTDEPTSHTSTAFNSILGREQSPAYVEITCPKCDGRGTIMDPNGNPLTGSPCNLCKSTGKIKYLRKNPPCCHGTGVCTVCDGKTKVSDGHGYLVPCRACQGTGMCGGWIYDKRNGLISRPCLKNR